jgi:hypothetical protein
MTDQPKVPVPNGDPELEQTLRGLSRFSPRQGFVDRVVGRVTVPLPAWARRLRDRYQATFSGVTGWTILATFSLATAAAWGTAIVAGVRYGDVAIGGTSVASAGAWQAIQRAAADAVVRPAVELLASAEAWAAGIGLPLRTLAVAYGLLALVSAVILRRLTAEPARAKGAINVVR